MVRLSGQDPGDTTVFGKNFNTCLKDSGFRIKKETSDDFHYSVK